jgi:hypothetical protein
MRAYILSLAPSVVAVAALASISARRRKNLPVPVRVVRRGRR